MIAEAVGIRREVWVLLEFVVSEVLVLTGNWMLVRKVVSAMIAPSYSSNVAERFAANDWDPLPSVDQNVDFNVSAGHSSNNIHVQESCWKTLEMSRSST